LWCHNIYVRATPSNVQSSGTRDQRT
jgi:hypothetical protein